MRKITKVILVSLCVLCMGSCTKQISQTSNSAVANKNIETVQKTGDINNYVGIYKYENGTESFREDQYVILENTSGKITGRYYGTSDDFDDVREGYLPGFFVSDMKELQIKGNEILFTIQLKEDAVFSKQIGLTYKNSEDVKIYGNPVWVNNQVIKYSKKNPLKYKGKIESDKITFEVEYGGPRTFKKISKIPPITIFSPDDANAIGIKLDMEKNEVEKILGKPKQIKKQFEGAFGTDVLYYYYDFGNVRLEPLDADKYTVSSVIIDMPNFAGPRSIKIGDSVDTVLSKFPPISNKGIIKDGEKNIYGNSENNCGYISYDKSGRIESIAFMYGEGGFGSYSLRYNIKEDKVISIGFSVMNI